MKYARSILIRQFAHMNNKTGRHNQCQNKMKRTASLLCIINAIYLVIIAYFISNAHYMQLKRD